MQFLFLVKQISTYCIELYSLESLVKIFFAIASKNIKYLKINLVALAPPTINNFPEPEYLVNNIWNLICQILFQGCRSRPFLKFPAPTPTPSHTHNYTQCCGAGPILTGSSSRLHNFCYTSLSKKCSFEN